MNKRIYISVPITGQNMVDVERKVELASAMIERAGDIAVSPLQLAHDSGSDYAKYMGKDIEELLRCDGIMMCDGWTKSRGCRLERECASIYGKKIQFMFKKSYE